MLGLARLGGFFALLVIGGICLFALFLSFFALLGSHCFRFVTLLLCFLALGLPLCGDAGLLDLRDLEALFFLGPCIFHKPGYAV